MMHAVALLALSRTFLCKLDLQLALGPVQHFSMQAALVASSWPHLALLSMQAALVAIALGPIQDFSMQAALVSSSWSYPALLYASCTCSYSSWPRPALTFCFIFKWHCSSTSSKRQQHFLINGPETPPPN